MSELKYKVGDKVLIKSIDWYNKNKDKYGTIYTSNGFCFCDDMTKHCGDIMKIIDIIVDPKDSNQGYYIMDNVKKWTDEMIEGLVEEECPQDFIEKYCNSCGTQRCDRTKEYLNGCPYYNAYMCKKQNNDMEEEMKSEDGLLDEYEELTDRAFKGGYEKCKSDIELNGFQLPEGYIFKDENSNIINATKIVLEKKPDDKLKLESTKKVREYWSEYARIYIEIYDNEPNECVLTHLYTLEGHRQKGYGKQALIEAELIAKELGCHTAYIKVETNSWMHEWYLRRGYKWYKTADEGYTWLIKNLTSIEKKKKEYPKTYEECCKVLGVNPDNFLSIRNLYRDDGDEESTDYERDLLGKFDSLWELTICRNAYWKIAGEEMGLGKPWEPDWEDSEERRYSIVNIEGDINLPEKTLTKWILKVTNKILVFPTEEMRDAFYENFKSEIEICKELL